MIEIDARGLDHRALNEAIRAAAGDCSVVGCTGQRFLAAGLGGDRAICVSGIPGNALGAYLDGACIEVFGNAQDAVGDTMNAGRILVHGNLGDTVGYAMRGGRLYAKGSAGYRAGIHMKAYQDKLPILMIGGRAGSFLGEYQAGGLIVVLGLETGGRPIVGDFPCAGMHGGKLFLRSACREILFPPQVTAHRAAQAEKEEIRACVAEFCALFGYDADAVLGADYTVVTPDSSNPYRQLYVEN